MTTSRHLAERAAVVAGSSRGIGRAVAHALAAQGARVVVNGRHADAANEVVDSIRSAGGEATACVGSVGDFEFAAQLIDTCERDFGPIEILVNCSGIAEPPGSSILDLSAEDWAELIGSHLTATFNTCRHATPRMVARGAGVIVNTSSHAARGVYGGTGYPAGKGGTESLTLAMAAELRPHGVRVNAVCPGAQTRLSSGPDYERHIADLHARGLLDDGLRDASLAPPPAEFVAQLYALLASDLAAGITGRIFSGAGGYVGSVEAGTESLIAFRDHGTEPPWPLEELAEKLRASGLP